MGGTVIGVPIPDAAAAPIVVARGKGQLFPLVVPIIDVDNPIGTIALRADQDGNFLVPKASLAPFLASIAGKDRADALIAKLPDKAEIDAADAALAGITLRFDTRKVQLVVELPAADRTAKELPISLPPRVPAPTSARRMPSGFSAYTNFAFGLHNDPTLGSDETAGTIEMDSVARLGGFVLENQAYVEAGGGARRTVSRSGTRLSRDFPSLAIRASLGDTFTSSQGFLQSQDILGVSVFKDVEVFNPFISSRPTGRQSFRLERSADVSIYVNEQLVRQMHLGPGSYNLTNFAQLDGANDVCVETRDDLGQVHSYDFTSFFDSDLLAPKMSQWEFNAGVQALRVDRQLRYDYGEPIVSGFYRRGISQTLTLGASAQIRKDQSILGVEIVNANQLANFSLDAAVGYSNPGVGGALAVTVEPQLPGRVSKPGRRLDLFAELTSGGFGQNPINGLGESARFGVRYSDLVMHERLAIAAALAYTATSDAQARGYDLSVSAGYRLKNGFVVRVTPSFRQDIDGNRGFAVLFSLTKAFGPQSRARASYDTRDDRALAEYDYTSQFGGIGTFGANIVAERARNEDGSITANGTYVGDRFQANVGYSQYVEGPNGFDIGRTSAVIQTAVAFAGGKVAVGRPINDSFAIVTKHPSIGDRQVVVDPAMSDRGDDARSGSLGPALVPDLQSYTIAKPSYTVRDLPPGFDIGSGIFEFFPPYHSGYAVEVGSGRSASAVGFVTDPAGKPISVARGTLTSPDDRGFGEHDIFTNRNGRFGLLGLAPGKTYIAHFPDAGVSFTVKVPADATGFVDVGTITVRPEGEDHAH